MLGSLDPVDLLAHLRVELDALGACLTGDLAARVAACGDWTLRDLAEHVGQQLWAVTAVEEVRNAEPTGVVPRDRQALRDWYAGTSTLLLPTLSTDPATPAWTLAAPRRARSASGGAAGCTRRWCTGSTPRPHGHIEAADAVLRRALVP